MSPPPLATRHNADECEHEEYGRGRAYKSSDELCWLQITRARVPHSAKLPMPESKPRRRHVSTSDAVSNRRTNEVHVTSEEVSNLQSSGTATTLESVVDYGFLRATVRSRPYTRVDHDYLDRTRGVAVLRNDFLTATLTDV
jgi:hypothetical protein